MPERRRHRPPLSLESLRWIVGLFCGFVGAFFLVAPHRFTGPPYEHLLAYRGWLGGAILAAGVGLLALAVARPRRSIRIGVHLEAGLTLLGLALGFASGHAWTAVLVYSVMGLGVVAAAVMPDPRRSVLPTPPTPPMPPTSPTSLTSLTSPTPLTPPTPLTSLKPAATAASSAAVSGDPATFTFPSDREAGGDLFGLLMGVIAALLGGMLIALPGLPVNQLTREHRVFVDSLGLLMLVAGPVLVHVQLRRSPPRSLMWSAHLATGAALLGFGIFSVVPRPSWTGITFYWGCGLAVALLPWVRHRLAVLDSTALGTRLALASVLASSVSLIVAIAVVAAQEERLGTAQALALQQAEASAIAGNVRDYVELNGARAAAVAAMAGRLPMDPAAQSALLRRSLPLYPEAALLMTLDNAGDLIGSSTGTRSAAGAGGDAMPPPAILRDIAAANHRCALPVQLSGGDPRSGQLQVLLSAPILGLDGDRTGVLVMGFDSTALARRIGRPDSIVTLADGLGSTIARRNETAPRSAERSRLPTAWDHQLKSGLPPVAGELLTTFALVPDLGWVVAVERPHMTALAGITRGREVAFGLLLLVIPLAAGVGILAAQRITRPLGALADAVDELTAGNPAAPLPPSAITEVERLSAAFRVMRDRLAARTREGERLAAELRARAEALADADRRKDEFLAMLAHELRNPLGAIVTASYVVAQTSSPAPAAGRSIAIIQRQIQHLVRLVDDLLDMSRITLGKVELRRAEIDLVQIVHHAVETTRGVVAAREHRVELDLPTTPLPLHADATRLEQVLANLIRNAAKFTAPGGHIEILVKGEDPGAGGAEAVVRVRDNGVGISPDLLPRIFDLFTQGDQGLERSVGGLGIGLTLVRSLTEMHGGRVEAWSAGIGRGSEFVVRLPLLDAPPHAKPLEPEASAVSR